MLLIVNGQERECPEDVKTLAGFVAHLELKADRIAVEHNRKIAPRTRWNEIALSPGDRLEIVHFVGGGCDS
jgi:sulfur carrier protein